MLSVILTRRPLYRVSSIFIPGTWTTEVHVLMLRYKWSCWAHFLWSGRRHVDCRTVFLSLCVLTMLLLRVSMTTVISNSIHFYALSCAVCTQPFSYASEIRTLQKKTRGKSTFMGLNCFYSEIFKYIEFTENKQSFLNSYLFHMATTIPLQKSGRTTRFSNHHGDRQCYSCGVCKNDFTSVLLKIYFSDTLEITLSH